MVGGPRDDDQAYSDSGATGARGEGAAAVPRIIG
jgi:hypothetical protein